ncbi:MAG: hypothetical protein L7U87_07985 [Chlamydiales bacterium]|nr:hypothetical protein [Chlamydiales bacterium]
MKYRVLFSFFLLLTLLTSCKQYQSSEFTRYHDDGRIKPKVALVPVSFNEDFPFPWNLSREITENIRQEVLQQNAIYLPAEANYASSLTRRSSDLVGPYSPVLKGLQADHDFVVFVDLLNHTEEAYKGQSVKPVYTVYGEVNSVLKMALRLTIYDVRGSTPKSILQEIIHSNHMISKDGAETNYHKVVWQTDAYKTSPFGLAHSRLSKEIAKRISQYISISRS